MRIPILLMVVSAALTLSACDSRDDRPAPLPVGVAATVDGQPFRAGLTIGWSSPDGAAPIAVAGSVMSADGMRMILLNVPGRVGTYTETSPESFAGYSVSADTTMEMWMAGWGLPDTNLEIRVTAVDAIRAEGTFAFVARHVDEPARVVTVTGGTFNVSLQELPNASDAPGGRRDAIRDAARAFERAPPRPDAR